MNRIALGLSMVAAFSLLVVSCDDDDDGGTVGTDASVDAPVGPMMCKGTFASMNRARLAMFTSPTGKCAAPVDLDIICNNDLGGITRNCGLTCFNAAPTTDPTACTKACVATEVKAAVSDPCSSCYTTAVICSINNCAAECVADSASSGCIACQQIKGCLPAFFQCSGLPGGVPVQGDAGAPDAGADAPVDAGGQADASTDATAG